MPEGTQIQLVTFQLGEELYGVDIMDVKEIVKVCNVRQSQMPLTMLKEYLTSEAK